MHALVTAGGTEEPIDAVRTISNSSTGRLGAALAAALAERGVEVTLIASRALASRVSGSVGPGITVVPFGSFRDLAERLEEALSAHVDMVFMAAAVSDYSPVPHVGKLSSNSQTLSIELTRNPKLLDTLRDRAPDAYLVGFKLLSGVTKRVLIDTARGQLDRARLDLCFANDAATFSPGSHPAVLVDRVSAIRVQGSKAEVAGRLVDQVLGSRWPSTAHPPVEADRRVAEAVERVQAMGITQGELHQHAGGRWWRVNLATDEARASSQPRCGAGRLLALLSDERGPLVLSPQWVASAALVSDVGGLSAPAQGERLAAELATAAREGRYRGAGFAVTLGDCVLWHPDGRMPEPLEGAPEGLPIVDGRGRLVGSAVSCDGALGPWIAPAHRRAGHGDGVLAELDRRGVHLLAGDAPDFYVARGCRDLGGGRMLPPSLRDDLLQAASVAVVDTIHRRVLLGRRRTPPWLGYWVFPGGGVEAGESPWHAARRELLEETGLELSGVPFSQDSVAVGSGDRAWRIHHFRAATLRTGSVRATDELEPRWVEWEDLELLKPMASSTRRMLEGLRTLMVRW